MSKKPWIIAGSIIGALLVIYLGTAAFFMSHFLVNTTINGKDFSGKTAADVEEYLKEQVEEYELTIQEQNNVSDVITGTEISLTYKENSKVQGRTGETETAAVDHLAVPKSNTDITIEVDMTKQRCKEKYRTSRQ